MSELLKFNKYGRVLINQVVGVEVSDNDSVKFSSFLTIPDDGKEEVVIRLKYGKAVCYRVKRESLDAEMTRILKVLGWE